MMDAVIDLTFVLCFCSMRPPDSPPPESNEPSPLDHLAPYHWLITFLTAWSSRHRISETAMAQLFSALKAFFPMLEGTVLTVVPNALGVMEARILIMNHWPLTMKAALSTINMGTQAYDKYAMCPKDSCGAVIPLIEANNNQLCSRVISQATESPKVADVAVPIDAPRCSEPLFKMDRKEIAAKDMTNVPHLMYPYGGVARGLQGLLERPNFEKQCEHWRIRYNEHGKRRAWENVVYNDHGWPKDESSNDPIMSDVYDAQMWEDYMYTDAMQRPFLDAAEVQRANARAEHARWRAGGDPPSKPKKNTSGAAAAAASSPTVLPEALLLQASIGHRLPLLAASGTLALAINVDWFQRDRSQAYSLGGVYLTVLNLPREVRLLTENLIILGILPGPGTTTRESFQGAVRLISNELQTYFDGVQMKTHDHPGGKSVRAFLLNIVCDSDARAPMMGRMSHAATHACAYCFQPFYPRGGVKTGPNFAWSATTATVGASLLAPLRTDADHRTAALEWARLSGNKQTEHSKAHGSRYCSLMDLKYFDTIRGSPLDAMHNIYLGTCKALFYLLIDPYEVPHDSDEAKRYKAFTKDNEASLAKQNSAQSDSASASTLNSAAAASASTSSSFVTLPPLLTDSDLTRLQTYMHACDVPRDVGQIPAKISRKMSKFKAAEWANWTAIFAVPHLGELMREKSAQAKKNDKFNGFRFEIRHLELFIKMRTVAEHMRAYNISPSSIRSTERHLLDILKTTERLFGPNAIKPNLHFSLHVGQMLWDLGPTAGWSCNAYERYNGLLSNLPMNKAYAETCTMRRGLQLIAISHHARKRLDICSIIQTPGPTREDYQMILRVLSGEEAHVISNQDAVTIRERVTASGAHQITYEWNQQSFREFQKADDITGREPYPGILQEKGKFPVDLLVNPSTLHERTIEKFTQRPHLLNCLMTHYSKAYSDELIAAFSSPDDRNKAIELKNKGEPLPMHVDASFTVHPLLNMGGQVFGSRLCKSHKNSYIRMFWQTESKVLKYTLEYAQVDFYFTHHFMVPTTKRRITTYKNTMHHFAFVRWFKQAVMHKSSAELSHLQAADSPYLSKLPDLSKSTQAVICIQSLAGRWITCHRLNAKGEVFCRQALNIPFITRIHA